MLQSLAMRSELLTLSGISNLTAHGNYFVQSTPTEPDFWMGNQLILSDVSRDAEQTFALFCDHFPDATHRSIVWDLPNIDPKTLPDCAALGCEMDGFDTMTLQGPLREVAVPDGITLRPVVTNEDWTKVEQLQAEVGIEE